MLPRTVPTNLFSPGNPDAKGQHRGAHPVAAPASRHDAKRAGCCDGSQPQPGGALGDQPVQGSAQPAQARADPWRSAGVLRQRHGQERRHDDAEQRRVRASRHVQELLRDAAAGLAAEGGAAREAGTASIRAEAKVVNAAGRLHPRQELYTRVLYAETRHHHTL